MTKRVQTHSDARRQGQAPDKPINLLIGLIELIGWFETVNTHYLLTLKRNCPINSSNRLASENPSDRHIPPRGSTSTHTGHSHTEQQATLRLAYGPRAQAPQKAAHRRHPSTSNQGQHL